MLNPKVRSYGFTIVELLIVVIVIALLAALTTLAYNGVSQRAANSTIALNVNNFEKALKLHNHSTGNPLRANMSWFHSSITNMSGACIGNKWPTDAYMLSNGAWVNNGTWDVKAQYCGWYTNSAQAIMEATQMLNTEITNSPDRDAFPSVLGFPPITIAALTSGGATETFTIRGLRYGFNNNASNLASYIYYPYYGKSCIDRDATVRFRDTIWTSSGGSSWTGTFTTGGDYTSNNTSMCLRTVKY